MFTRACAIVLVASVATVFPASRDTAVPRVVSVATPDGGIQPQAVVDRAGAIHLLYFKGEPSHGDLFYVHQGPRAPGFSAPVRVNSEVGSAIATGSVRGGQIALGRDGRVHVAWNSAQPVDRNGTKESTMWYARSATDSSGFELQRPIGAHMRHLDGGGSVAADGLGRVYVSWHAAGEQDGETERRIYMAASEDDGRTFAAEKTVALVGGACGCCGLESLVDRTGRLQLLYRAAADGVYRDSMWLTLGQPGAIRLQAWELPACPMTTFGLANGPTSLIAAWETQQQIYTAVLAPSTRRVSQITPVAGTALRKHPSIAVNAAGDVLFAWTEGTAWARGGSVAWELRNRDGVRIGGAPDAGAVPVWGLVAAVAKPDSSFIIIH